jgi:hypothetical protein
MCFYLYDSLGYHQLLVQVVEMSTQANILPHLQGICHHSDVLDRIQRLLIGGGTKWEDTTATSCMCTLQFICIVQRTTSATQNKLHGVCNSHDNNYGLDTGQGKLELRPQVLSVLYQHLTSFSLYSVYNSIIGSGTFLEKIHRNLSNYIKFVCCSSDA